MLDQKWTINVQKKVHRKRSQPLGHRTNAGERSKKAEIIAKGEWRRRRIGFEELRRRSRRGDIPGSRSEITERVVKEFGMSLKGVAWLLGVSRSAISKMLQKRAQERGE